MIIKLETFLFTVLAFSLRIIAQDSIPNRNFTNAIEDNSFLIEESYNQEDRVVQHISNIYYRTFPSKDVIFSFTQEWPVIKYKHQLSYTIPYSFIDRNSLRGIGDILINYRYQLFYKENWVCFSPRLSLILPTGNYMKGLGYDVPGVQINLPFSKRLSDFWVVHFNAGYTLLPQAKVSLPENGSFRKTLSFYNLGGSVIWLVGTNFNFMFECVENLNSIISSGGVIEHSSETIVNPGVRVAMNIGDLQIVPGISMPILLSGSDINPWFLFYLSFEHPF